MNLIQSLPEELLNILCSYLEYKYIILIEEFLSVNINYEKLLRGKNVLIWNMLINMSKIDYHLKKYINCWQFIYYDLEILGDNIDITKIQVTNVVRSKLSMISIDLLYSTKIFVDYTDYYNYKRYLNEMGVNSYNLSYWMINFFKSIGSEIALHRISDPQKDLSYYNKLMAKGYTNRALYLLCLLYMKTFPVRQSLALYDCILAVIKGINDSGTNEEIEYRECLKEGLLYFSEYA
jgi:hypothetical protein